MRQRHHVILDVAVLAPLDPLLLALAVTEDIPVSVLDFDFTSRRSLIIVQAPKGVERVETSRYDSQEEEAAVFVVAALGSNIGPTHKTYGSSPGRRHHGD